MRIDPARLNRTGLQEPKESAAVSRQRFAKSETAEQTAATPLPPLEVGQEISAVIVGELDDGRIILNLGGALIEANNPGGLAAGQNLRLRVDFLEPQVMLHIVEQEFTIENEAASLLRQRLPGPSVADQTLIALKRGLDAPETLLDSSAAKMSLDKLRGFVGELLDDHGALNPERLMRLVRDGGLHYENKLFRAVLENSPSLATVVEGDLKGLLLGALEDLGAAAAWGEPRSAIAGQLDHLEIQQAVNILAQLEGQPLQVRIPFFTGAAFTDVALAVQRDGKGRPQDSAEQPQGYTIMFLLDLDNFGRTRIEAHLKGRDLRVVFYADLEESVALLRRELPALNLSLKAMGYRDVLLTAKATRTMREEQQERFQALALGVPLNLHLLNVKV